VMRSPDLAHPAFTNQGGPSNRKASTSPRSGRCADQASAT
jgi:hypothetical protein